MTDTYLFTSESVSDGHPDKIADQISDAILDACLAQDPHSKVACEALVTTGLVILAGEITTEAKFSVEEVVRETIKSIGYDKSFLGFDYRSCGIISTLKKQSDDIAQGVEKGKGVFKAQGAGDQGIMFGYACDETKEYMPMPFVFANKLLARLKKARSTKEIPYLLPDAKAQITIEYKNSCPFRIHTIVLSTQHTDDVSYEKVVADMKELIQQELPKEMIDSNTLFYINPTGRFVIGGPKGDCGLTGRKIIIDTYGGYSRHGGGCFSGKDPSKVDRSAAYGARYVAKNIVAANLAKRCEVQLSYAIGVPFPISIKVDTFGTSDIDENLISLAVKKCFDLSPQGLIDSLNLKRPIYKKTAFGGHFGRDDEDFTWEKTDKVNQLIGELKKM